MDINRLIKDKEFKEFLIVFIIVIVAALYAFYRPDIIKETETSKIDIELASKPEYEEYNGDNVENISFKAKGYRNYFDISHSALLYINISDITNLNIGDGLKLLVDKNDLKIQPRKHIYHPITVCGIEKPNKEILLTLNDYNKGARNRWKEFILIGTFLCFAYITVIIKIIKKYRNNNG
nr:hypothetical protein [uncultured Carboxylicivirga sp.]